MQEKEQREKPSDWPLKPRVLAGRGQDLLGHREVFLIEQISNLSGTGLGDAACPVWAQPECGWGPWACVCLLSLPPPAGPAESFSLSGCQALGCTCRCGPWHLGRRRRGGVGTERARAGLGLTPEQPRERCPPTSAPGCPSSVFPPCHEKAGGFECCPLKNAISTQVRVWEEQKFSVLLPGAWVPESKTIKCSRGLHGPLGAEVTRRQP